MGAVAGFCLESRTWMVVGLVATCQPRRHPLLDRLLVQGRPPHGEHRTRVILRLQQTGYALHGEEVQRDSLLLQRRRVLEERRILRPLHLLDEIDQHPLRTQHLIGPHDEPRWRNTPALLERCDGRCRVAGTGTEVGAFQAGLCPQPLQQPPEEERDHRIRPGLPLRLRYFRFGLCFLAHVHPQYPRAAVSHGAHADSGTPPSYNASWSRCSRCSTLLSVRERKRHEVRNLHPRMRHALPGRRVRPRAADGRGARRHMGGTPRQPGTCVRGYG